MALNPLDVPTPGKLGTWRDMARENAQLKRDQANIRATTLTKQELPDTPPAHTHPWTDITNPPVAPSGARTVRLSTGTVTSGGWRLMEWQSDATHGTAVGAPAASDLRAEVAGLYAYSVQVTLGYGGSANGREIRMLRNGAEDDKAIVPTDDNISLRLGRAIHLNANDVLSIEISHGAGITLGLSGGASSWFTLALIRGD